MRAAGLAPDRLRFLGLPDGGLSALTAAERQGVRRRLSNRRTPDVIICPAADDDHPDHREATRLADLAFTPSIPRLHYGVWSGPRTASPGRRSGTGLSLRLGASAWRKRRVLQSYATQTGAITDDPSGFVLTDKLIRQFAGPAERFHR